MSHEEDEHFQVLASYFPRGFAIELKAYTFAKPLAGPGMPSFDDSTFPVFMHEVGHLVQDRSTFRGVMDFLDMWDQIDAVKDYVRRCGEIANFPIVDVESGRSRLDAASQWAVELAKFREHREPRRSWTNGRFWAFEKYSVEIRRLTLDGRQIDYPFVTVHLVDNTTGELYQHPIGAWEICEAYSVAVELLHGGNVSDPSNMFEYLVVERIISTQFGDVPPDTLVALCHWALQDLAPANALFTLIEGIEEEYDTLPDSKEVYDFGRREAFSRGFPQNCEEIIGSLRDRERAMLSQEPNLGRMFSWFRVHAEALLNLQMRPDRRFPLDTFLCKSTRALKPEQRTEGLVDFVKEVEIPLIVWPDGEFYSINHSADAVSAVFLNRCMSHLFQRLWDGAVAEWECPLFKGCELPCKDESDCKTLPWRKCTIRPACPYGAAAKLIGFNDDKAPEFRPFET